MNFITSYISSLIIYPLKLLYYDGPLIMGFGGWQGIPKEDICSQLTKVPSTMWLGQIHNCTDLIERHFNSYLIAFFATIYFLFIYKIIAHLWFKYFILKPILQEIKLLYQSNSRETKIKDA